MQTSRRAYFIRSCKAVAKEPFFRGPHAVGTLPSGTVVFTATLQLGGVYATGLVTLTELTVQLTCTPCLPFIRTPAVSVCRDFGYALPLAVREPERVKPTKALQPTKARAFTRNAKDRKKNSLSSQTDPPKRDHPALVRPSHSSSAIRCQVAAELPFPQLPLRFPFSSAPFVGSLSQPLWEASHNLYPL